MRHFIVLLICLLPIITFAQQTSDNSPKVDKRLYEVFDQSYLNFLSEKNPFLIQYYNFFLDNAYQIVDKAPKQYDNKEITIHNLDKINILEVCKKQSLKRGWDYIEVYPIANTNKLLVLYSEQELSKKLNVHLGRTY